MEFVAEGTGRTCGVRVCVCGGGASLHPSTLKLSLKPSYKQLCPPVGLVVVVVVACAHACCFVGCCVVGSGAPLIISAVNQGPSNVYVQAVTWRGVPVPGVTVAYPDLMQVRSCPLQ